MGPVPQRHHTWKIFSYVSFISEASGTLNYAFIMLPMPDKVQIIFSWIPCRYLWIYRFALLWIRASGEPAFSLSTHDQHAEHDSWAVHCDRALYHSMSKLGRTSIATDRLWSSTPSLSTYILISSSSSPAKVTFTSIQSTFMSLTLCTFLILNARTPHNSTSTRRRVQPSS